MSNELDAALLAWAQAGGDVAEVERRAAAVKARVQVEPAPEPPKVEPAKPRIPIMDLSRPRLDPSPRVPWRNPEYEAEVAQMRAEMDQMIAEARDPFASGKPREKTSDDSSISKLGIKK